ncbi:alpha/beta hydrolase [Salinispora arenicola]|uniref:alpha/beta fold hydrolase n=1 Tax=Salinispora arenicola TaxID=168697 RepID=UPI0014309700|nr:alpha/beta hydrolase [Salinispora arenicola]NIL40121.1 alpha/beta hydrolase [Salinispora arenicola]
MENTEVSLHTLWPGTPDGPLVVFAHGLEDPWTTWRPLVAELDPTWRMVALDLPWRPGNDYRWGHRPAGDWLGDGLDQLGARSDVLITHSFGANAALTLLSARDPRPGPAVILVCPLYRQPQHSVTWEMFDQARATFMRHIREGLRARMGARADALDPEVLEAMGEAAIDRVGPAGFLTVFQQYIASAQLRLSNVTVRTFLLAGAADPTLSPVAARALAAEVPGMHLQVEEQFDHFCHVRQAGRVADSVAAFVAANGAFETTGREPR